MLAVFLSVESGSSALKTGSASIARDLLSWRATGSFLPQDRHYGCDGTLMIS
jgi:hypothetical protein